MPDELTDQRPTVIPPVDLIEAERQQQTELPHNVFDDTPLQPLQPIQPPSHVAPPPLNAPARQTLKSGSPVTQETFTRQTIYPGTGVTPGMLNSPGTTRKYKSCIEYLASLSQDPNNGEYNCEVWRTAPAIYNGQRFMFGIVERFPPAPYPEIFNQIKEVHGGGSYRLRVMNGEGQQMHMMMFNIDTLTNPPINNVQNNGAGIGLNGQQLPRGTAAFASVGGDIDDTIKLKNEETRLRAEEQKMLTESRVEQTRENIERQRERRLGAPAALEANRAVDSLRGELTNIQHQNDRRFDQMMATFDKLIMQMNQPKADNGKDLLIFAEMMKAQSAQQTNSTQQMTAILTAVLSNGSNKGGELAEAMKMQNESNKAIVQMTIQSATAAASKSERLLEQMITNRLEHPDNAVKAALENRESGWKQAMQVFEMMEEARGPREQEEVINPDGGFFGNLGNLFLHGLKNLVAGGAKGAGGKMMETLASMLNKPAGTTQFSENDLARAAQQLEREELARRALPQQVPNALPAPAQQIMPPAPLPPQPQRRPNPFQRVFDRVYFTEDQVAAPTPPPVQQEVPPSISQTAQAAPVPTPSSDALESVELEEEPPPTAKQEPVIAPAPVAVSEQKVQADDSLDEQLKDYVTEAVVMAISDIKAGRKEHDWVDFALGKWGNFLLDLVKAPDDAARVKMIQAYCEPEVFQEIVQLLMNQDNNAKNYRDFIENLHGLLEEAGKEAVSA